MDNIVAANIEIAKQRVRDKIKTTFFTLKKRVADPGLCIECGKCVSLCEAIGWNEAARKPDLIGKCIACGLCYFQCPVTPGSPIGDFKKAWVTRAAASDIKGQDGGTVTALLASMLANGEIDAAIVTRQDPSHPWHPHPVIATTREAILEASGTIYTHSPVVPVLVDAVNAGHRRIAVVATACKIGAIRELLDGDDGILRGIDGLAILTIGLFCSESFVPEKLLSFLGTKVDPAAITKMRISSGTMWVHHAGGKETFGLTSSAEDFASCMKKSCANCHDLTAEGADISVGNIGSDSKHNTVLVRTARGEQALAAVLARGDLEAREAKRDELKPLIEIAWLKKERGVVHDEQPSVPGKFKEHEPASWHVDEYDYTPEVHEDLYVRQPHDVVSVNHKPGASKVLVARVPGGDTATLTSMNYSTAYDLTFGLLKDRPRLKGGKVFVKPNNTGFVGIFKHNPKLAPILERNGITDDADHQPLATQPATLRGIVDAMLDLGVARIHVGENMLWEGGTRRAYYETGYSAVFSAARYAGKVFFVDFCEDDPPPSEYRKLAIKRGKYDISDYYTSFYPPKAFFEEKYDLVFIASIAKVHNCSYYSLVAKNFSVSMNPRKKTGKIEPRWHIHGVPPDVFTKDYLQGLLGPGFKREFQYLLRETYPHEWGANLKEKTVKPDKSRVLLTGRMTTKLAMSLPATFHSSGLMKWFKSYGKRVLNVDPHHWAGVNVLPLNLGMGYLTTRFTGMYAAMVDALKANGTEIASLVSGIVAQEGDGPLIYGNAKHGGFAVAGFDAAAVEKACLDVMFGVDGDFTTAIVAYQRGLMERFGVTSELLLDEARRAWTLELLAELTGGTIDNDAMDISILDYARDGTCSTLGPRDLYKIRQGSPFTFSEAFYCSPDTWLRLVHTDEAIFKIAFNYTTKTIEIPLIPDVVG